MADRKVCIIFNTDFGESLRQLDLSAPVWIVQSEQNNPTIANLWKTKVGNVTSFRPQEFEELIDTVDQHHPGWVELEVHGLRSDEAEIVLVDYGGGHFTTTPDGFVFRRNAW